MEKKEATNKASIGLLFQLFLIFVNITILIGLIIWGSRAFSSHEIPPKLERITPQKYQKLGGFSHTATVGLLVDQFTDFNMINNTFTFDGTLWFKFDPGAISLDSLSKFSFIKGTIDSRSEPDIQIVDDKMLVKYVVRVTFESDLNYKDFPLDSHSIYLGLINKFITPSEILFKSSRKKFTVNANVSGSGWDLVDTSVINGFIKSSLDAYDAREDLGYPATIFIFEYARNSIRYALSIILPLTLIFYILLFSLSLGLTNAIEITSAGITAILAYRFVIESLSPKTGLFIVSDYLFFIFLAACIVLFLLNIVEIKKTLSPLSKKIYIIILHCAVILAVTYVIVW